MKFLLGFLFFSFIFSNEIEKNKIVLTVDGRNLAPPQRCVNTLNEDVAFHIPCYPCLNLETAFDCMQSFENSTRLEGQRGVAHECNQY